MKWKMNMGFNDYFKIEDEITTVECSFCGLIKPCVTWFNPEDLSDKMCIDCATKIVNIIKKT